MAKTVKVTIEAGWGEKVVCEFPRDKKIKSIIDNTIKELSDFERPKTHSSAKGKKPNNPPDGFVAAWDRLTGRGKQ